MQHRLTRLLLMSQLQHKFHFDCNGKEIQSSPQTISVLQHYSSIDPKCWSYVFVQVPKVQVSRGFWEHVPSAQNIKKLRLSLIQKPDNQTLNLVALINSWWPLEKPTHLELLRGGNEIKY